MMSSSTNLPYKYACMTWFCMGDVKHFFVLVIPGNVSSGGYADVKIRETTDIGRKQEAQS